jgi:DNA-binding response OmpR family regulator
MRILVVDDEQHLAELFASMLTDDGQFVETATNGDDAFHLCCKRLSEGKPFDFLILS